MLMNARNLLTATFVLSLFHPSLSCFPGFNSPSYTPACPPPAHHFPISSRFETSQSLSSERNEESKELLDESFLKELTRPRIRRGMRLVIFGSGHIVNKEETKLGKPIWLVFEGIVHEGKSVVHSPSI